MFDKTYVGILNSAPEVVRITEKRAPTDESVRLLREMEQKAQDEVIRSFKIETNEFHGVLQEMKDVYDDSTKYRMIFYLNGHKHIITDARSSHEPMDKFVQRFIKMISESVAQQVTRALSAKIQML